MQPSEEIKAKLNIVDVIREHIQLTAAGVNFRAKCPFHRENSPSFVVSPEKQIYHCFGCGEGGDMFSFIMKIEGIDFVEALRILAAKAGVPLKRQNQEMNSKRNLLLDIIDMSRRYYHKLLIESAEAKGARAYLAKRGLSKETIEEWQIGYSPDSWDRIGGLLKEKGYKENEIFLAGLIVKSEKANKYYDRFRGRIMFPINDANGSTVGFSARISPEKEATDKMGKYINSPQTPVYDKGKLLFGLDKARSEIKKADLAILVEGQMDAITAHQAGYKNIIASSGTALSNEQVQLLKRFSNNIALSFDMDAAGEMAAERGIREAMEADMNIRVIELPFGKDPDECIKNRPDDWKNAVAVAKPMMQYYFDKTFSALDLKRVEDKRQAVRVLLPIIMKIKNLIEKDFWLKRLAEKLDVSTALLLESVGPARTIAKRVNSEVGPRKIENAPLAKTSREEALSELFLALIIKFNLYFDYAFGNLPVEQLFGSANRGIYKNLIIYYNINNRNEFETSDLYEGQNSENALFSVLEFTEWLKSSIGENFDNSSNNEQNELESSDIQNQLKLINKLVILGDEEYSEIDEARAKIELINLIAKLKKSFRSNRKKELAKLITIAERNDDKNELKILMQEFKVLSDQERE
ncbi:MAG: primase protein [Candidatus Falkowbacteria bacterium GW2011_GWC2_38_22]|nr:MAG: primase protein [Candidatus Falkowbacteria bacterium GW2011_GWF2_38_1205]KKQ60596.1 MAG: primase protein [Candidatus Falkowbacteria bacterium GW2011_GWC2_38_22]KKQ62687.1 MAG: primase protein [Candidatus Falkowbacteria bacterium GW2011_GWF1_38_22]KKQ64814.1 MAG: primase protein [Candidatus Falkowbacteria bacterium GW2011_GWE2_38_254]KKQ72056.1 MAG: primase protein [Candidatus Falkowbacteria bacterium GW2011_GWD2_38_42]HAM88870.1 DNA primase [Candidatus Falkowbacteria bacterium]